MLRQGASPPDPLTFARAFRRRREAAAGARPTVTVVRAALCLSLTLPFRRSAPATHDRGFAASFHDPPATQRNDEAGEYAAGLARLGVDCALPFR